MNTETFSSMTSTQLQHALDQRRNDLHYARRRLQVAQAQCESAEADLPLIQHALDQREQEDAYDRAVNDDPWYDYVHREPPQGFRTELCTVTRARSAVPVRRWNRTQPLALLERRLRDSDRTHRM